MLIYQLIRNNKSKLSTIHFKERNTKESKLIALFIVLNITKIGKINNIATIGINRLLYTHLKIPVV